MPDPSTAWGRLTMATSFFSSSSSFSFCFFLPPPFSAVVAPGEYSRPACSRRENPESQGGQRLEPLFPLGGGSSQTVRILQRKGWRAEGTPGPQFANQCQGHRLWVGISGKAQGLGTAYCWASAKILFVE